MLNPCGANNTQTWLVLRGIMHGGSRVFFLLMIIGETTAEKKLFIASHHVCEANLKRQMFLQPREISFFCIPSHNFHWLEELFSSGFKFHGNLERKMDGCVTKDRQQCEWEMDLSRPDAGLLIARQDWCELDRSSKIMSCAGKNRPKFSEQSLFQLQHVNQSTMEYQVISKSKRLFASNSILELQIVFIITQVAGML